MSDHDWLAEQFERHRDHLRAVAYRMLGSLDEADDAVQQAWLRLSRSEANAIENLGGWLTTVVARVSLDMLRSRESRREDSLEPVAERASGHSPEDEIVVANSVGLALLVVLDTLAPAERLAFVLHDVFGMPFEEIAPIVDKSPEAARQLASRARRRVRGASPPERDVARQREVVDAFLAAARGGDLNGLLAVLDPDVLIRGVGPELRGAALVADRAIKGGARAAQAAIIDGAMGVIVAPGGKLMMVLRFKIENGKIVEIEGITGRERLKTLDIGVA